MSGRKAYPILAKTCKSLFHPHWQEFYLQKVKSQDNGNSTKESGKKEESTEKGGRRVNNRGGKLTFL
jgi:hypothetical protein